MLLNLSSWTKYIKQPCPVMDNRWGGAADDVSPPNTLAAICPGKRPHYGIYVVHRGHVKLRGRDRSVGAVRAAQSVG